MPLGNSKKLMGGQVFEYVNSCKNSNDGSAILHHVSALNRQRKNEKRRF
jgi:hypothetical protein